MAGVTVSHNIAIDGGAFEVAEQAGSSFSIPTQLIITVNKIHVHTFAVQCPFIQAIEYNSDVSIYN